MTNLRDLLKAARREQSTVHQMHLQDGSRVTTTHSTGPATHELIALAPQLAAALIEAREALAIALEDLDEAIALIEELPAAIRAMIAAQREDGTW